jgi:microcystin degradation protein MlrC
MGTKLLVYSDGDKAAGAALARRLADELVSLRDALGARYPGIDEALDEALAFDDGPVVLADSADNPGGGAPGDSTFILRRLVERGLHNACLGPLWDPVAVRIAFDAGVGARLNLRVGGKIGPLSGQPMDLAVTVKALHADMVMTGLANTPTALGDCACVECDGIHIVLISVRNQAMNTDLFTQLGIDLAAMKIIVVKSSQHFYASFSSVAKHVIYVGAPGAMPMDIRTLPYRNIHRPKWPID